MKKYKDLNYDKKLILLNKFAKKKNTSIVGIIISIVTFGHFGIKYLEYKRTCIIEIIKALAECKELGEVRRFRKGFGWTLGSYVLLLWDDNDISLHDRFEYDCPFAQPGKDVNKFCGRNNEDTELRQLLWYTIWEGTCYEDDDENYTF